ncbi:hypothetical protein B8V81_0418 [Paenibacillus pasadenensis]|uniref:Uncharacterized protein n=1 Tax=Paenibacillus pasadenensis TaxID=217090 RepID=A0A2N5ND57_9BACL|nr:hypothetical protein B8V81_0418 [Paenibacillus pasadenensis]
MGKAIPAPGQGIVGSRWPCLHAKGAAPRSVLGSLGQPLFSLPRDRAAELAG